jgi:hypothetical protein
MDRLPGHAFRYSDPASPRSAEGSSYRIAGRLGSRVLTGGSDRIRPSASATGGRLVPLFRTLGQRAGTTLPLSGTVSRRSPSGTTAWVVSGERGGAAVPPKAERQSISQSTQLHRDIPADRSARPPVRGSASRRSHSSRRRSPRCSVPPPARCQNHEDCGAPPGVFRLHVLNYVARGRAPVRQHFAAITALHRQTAFPKQAARAIPHGGASRSRGRAGAE